MTHIQISNQELTESLILSGQFKESSFSEIDLEKYSNNDKGNIYHQIKELMQKSEYICDELRSTKSANYENFKKLLNKEFIFSNEEIGKHLYNYGMFTSK